MAPESRWTRETHTAFKDSLKREKESRRGKARELRRCFSVPLRQAPLLLKYRTGALVCTAFIRTQASRWLASLSSEKPSPSGMDRMEKAWITMRQCLPQLDQVRIPFLFCRSIPWVRARELDRRVTAWIQTGWTEERRVCLSVHLSVCLSVSSFEIFRLVCLFFGTCVNFFVSRFFLSIHLFLHLTSFIVFLFSDRFVGRLTDARQATKTNQGRKG